MKPWGSGIIILYKLIGLSFNGNYIVLFFFIGTHPEPTWGGGQDRNTYINKFEAWCQVGSNQELQKTSVSQSWKRLSPWTSSQIQLGSRMGNSTKWVQNEQYNTNRNKGYHLLTTSTAACVHQLVFLPGFGKVTIQNASWNI